jgi:hypothetical protein
MRKESCRYRGGRFAFARCRPTAPWTGIVTASLLPSLLKV